MLDSIYMDPVPACFYRISVKALILDETRERFLLVQEDNGKWEFPGGGLDFGETPFEGLKRELNEEMGLEATWISPSPSYFLTDVTSKGTQYANLFYEVKVKDLNFTPSEECVALRFVSPEEVKDLKAFGNVIKLAEMFEKARA